MLNDDFEKVMTALENVYQRNGIKEKALKVFDSKWTLIHGDCHQMNLFFKKGVDWTVD